MVAIYLEVARGVREFWWCCGRLLSGPKGGVVQKGGSRLTARSFGFHSRISPLATPPLPGARPASRRRGCTPPIRSHPCCEGPHGSWYTSDEGQLLSIN